MAKKVTLPTPTEIQTGIISSLPTDDLISNPVDVTLANASTSELESAFFKALTSEDAFVNPLAAEFVKEQEKCREYEAYVPLLALTPINCIKPDKYDAENFAIFQADPTHRVTYNYCIWASPTGHLMMQRWFDEKDIPSGPIPRAWGSIPEKSFQYILDCAQNDSRYASIARLLPAYHSARAARSDYFTQMQRLIEVYAASSQEFLKKIEELDRQ